MFESDEKLRANRANAQKSTGPKTARGKAISSKNAVKHGLHVRDIIVNSKFVREKRSEYELLLASLIEELQPESAFQEYLVRKIANCIWRSRRAINAETARINNQLNRIDREIEMANRLKNLTCGNSDDDDDSDDSDADENRTRKDLIRMRSIPDINFSFNILRYEMRLDRQLSRAFRLLQQLKSQKPSSQKSPGWPTACGGIPPKRNVESE